MIKGIVVIFLLLILTVAAAGAVIVGFALLRRPADEWKKRLREQPSDIEVSTDTVAPRRTSLTDVMSQAQRSNAYFDADRLPGIERIEVVTDRIEAMNARRRARQS